MPIPADPAGAPGTGAERAAAQGAGPSVTEAVVVGRIRREYHQRGIDPAGIRRIGGSVHGSSVSYLVHPADGEDFVVRACRADAPVPVQFQVLPSSTPLDWLVTRAATLDFLERTGYPAPRLVRTHAGDPVGLDGIWLTMATSYVAGEMLQPTLGQLRLLGEALGRLHSVVLPEAGPGSGAGSGVELPGSGAVSGVEAAGPGVEAGGPGLAAWAPQTAIPATLARLDRVADLVPDGVRPMWSAFRETILAVRERLGELPHGVVHGDAWAANAVQSAPGEVTLIDWETGGQGLPILDLGYGLIECLLDARPTAGGDEAEAQAGPDRPGLYGAGPDHAAAWLVRPGEARITALAAGYAARRALTPAEQDVLLPAIRFGAAYIGALHLEQALGEGVTGPSMDARLERLRNRLSESEAVATLAAPHLTRGPEPVR